MALTESVQLATEASAIIVALVTQVRNGALSAIGREVYDFLKSLIRNPLEATSESLDKDAIAEEIVLKLMQDESGHLHQDISDAVKKYKADKSSNNTINAKNVGNVGDVLGEQNNFFR